ncbi:hypothetical protein A464_2178 [Salmonella bongori N268-08]|uniref:Uncharacterized protein n=1 Tax=Salmonella bongori N268-08 TaxID=1197719 RepID=S5MXF8_SALBN|nr:hypothetical protein A464_2178 [Salmonella bongori N268-08]
MALMSAGLSGCWSGAQECQPDIRVMMKAKSLPEGRLF